MRLAFDFQPARFVAALGRGERLLASREIVPETRHADELFPTLQKMLEEVGVGFGEIAHFACVTGPASFSRVRAAVCAVRGLAMGAAAHALGFTRFAVLAEMAGLSEGSGGASDRTHCRWKSGTAEGHGMAEALPSGADCPAGGRENAALLVVEPGMGGQWSFQPFGWRAGRTHALAPPGLVEPDAAAAYLPDGLLICAGEHGQALAAMIGARAHAPESLRRPGAADLLRAVSAALREDAPPPAPLYLRPPAAAKAKPPIALLD